MAFKLGLIVIELCVLFDTLALECQKEEMVFVKYFIPRKIRKLVTYEDISIFNFEVPEDVCELFLSLKAYGSSRNKYGMLHIKEHFEFK